MFTLCLIAGAVITVAMLLSGGWILRAMNASDEAFDDTLAYLNICMGGTLFVVGYNAVSAVLRGMGDSKHPLIFVAISAGLNVVCLLYTSSAPGGISAGSREPGFPKDDGHRFRC